MTYTRVGVVTGANKGVGKAIVRQLALQYPQSRIKSGPLLIYLTARDQSRGEEALKDLLNDSQLTKAGVLASAGGLADIKFKPLDIASSDSIKDFSNFIKQEHPDGIDFLINNAGIALTGFDESVVKTTLRCNYYGTLEMVQIFTPLMKPQPTSRIVNVASISGALTKLSPKLAERFRAVRTVSDSTALMEEFTDAVHRGAEQAEGWQSAAYATSKAGVIAMTQALAESTKEEGKGLVITSCCPGWVVTDMTKGKGAKTPDQGAQTPVMLALGDEGGKEGLFWRDEKVMKW